MPFTYWNGKTFEKLNAKRFKELTNSVYIDEVSMSANDFYKQWTQESKKEFQITTTFNLEVREAYKRYLKKPKKLYIAQCGSLKIGVFPGEDIKKGDVISKYCGRFVEDPDKLPSRAYVLGNIDGIDMRDEGPLVNDGLPNAIYEPLQCCDGLEDRSLIVAIDDIPAHQQIFVNYITGLIKSRGHIEPDYDRAKKFFSTHSISQIVKQMNSYYSFASPDLALFGAYSKSTYLIHTPSTAIRVFMDGIISYDDIKLLMKRPENVNLATTTGIFPS